MFGWVIFRIEEVDKIPIYFDKLFSFNLDTNLLIIDSFKVVLVFAFVFAFFTSFALGEKISKHIFESKKFRLREHFSLTFVSLIFLLLSISSITSSGFNPFIYFRF